MPEAPPSLAANAILPIINGECKGSSDKAWQDTISLVYFKLFKLSHPSIYVMQLLYK